MLSIQSTFLKFQRKHSTYKTRYKFLQPAVILNHSVEYKLLGKSLQREFPEKFAPENRQYVNVSDNNNALNFYTKFGYEKHVKLSGDNKPVDDTQKIRALREWAGYKTNLPYNTINGVPYDPDSPVFRHLLRRLFEIDNTLALKGNVSITGSGDNLSIEAENQTLKVQNYIPITKLNIPIWHPLLSYNINVPLQLDTKLPSRFKTHFFYAKNI